MQANINTTLLIIQIDKCGLFTMLLRYEGKLWRMAWTHPGLNDWLVSSDGDVPLRKATESLHTHLLLVCSALLTKHWTVWWGKQLILRYFGLRQTLRDFRHFYQISQGSYRFSFLFGLLSVVHTLGSHKLPVFDLQ